MGKRVPLIREDTGEKVGTAMVLNPTDPVKEFAMLAQADGVMIGLSVTDPGLVKLIQGDIVSSSFSVASKPTPRIVGEFLSKEAFELDGEEMARGMLDDIDEFIGGAGD